MKNKKKLFDEFGNYLGPDLGVVLDSRGVYSGTVQVRPAETVHVLGEMYGVDDEDVAVTRIDAVAIPRGGSQMPVSLVKAGNWVMLQGIDSNMAKTATVVSSKEGASIFAPLKFSQAGGESIVKLAIEPLNPSDLPKMVEGLRRVSKAYPSCFRKVVGVEILIEPPTRDSVIQFLCNIIWTLPAAANWKDCFVLILCRWNPPVIPTTNDTTAHCRRRTVSICVWTENPHVLFDARFGLAAEDLW